MGARQNEEREKRRVVNFQCRPPRIRVENLNSKYRKLLDSRNLLLAKYVKSTFVRYYPRFHAASGFGLDKYFFLVLLRQFLCRHLPANRDGGGGARAARPSLSLNLGFRSVLSPGSPTTTTTREDETDQMNKAKWVRINWL